MHRINQQRQRISRPSPNRYNTDTYIIQYKQSKGKINSAKDLYSVPVSPLQLLNQDNYKQDILKEPTKGQSEKYSQKYVDHRKNIDRLMDVLKSKSKSQDKGNSAVHKIMKIIDKIYQRYWRVYDRIMKRKGFKAIKTITGKFVKQTYMSSPFLLKDSLELQENEIQRFSKNFQLQDLIQIVDLHTQQNQQANPSLNNSLSRQLNHQQNIVNNNSRSSRRISQNIYIIKRNTKQELQTRPDLASLTTQKHINSIQSMPADTKIVQVIAADKIEGKSLQKNIQLKEKYLKSKQKQQIIHEIPLQELSIDSFIKAKPSQAEGQDIQIQKQLSKVKLPSFGEKYLQTKRTNRLMNVQNKGRKIVFHYKNSHQKIKNPVDNYYAGAKINQNKKGNKNQLADTRMETNSTNPSLPFRFTEQTNIFEPQQVRIQRSSSMQVLIPKKEFQHEVSPNKAGIKELEQLPLQKKRCSSMPKITFTYKIKDEVAAQPPIITQSFQKTSPICFLNGEKTSKQKDKIFIRNQNSNQSKNIETTNICNNNQEIGKKGNYIHSISIPQKIVQNDYKIPVQNYIGTNLTENSHQILQKVDNYRLQSNQQSVPNKSVFDNKIKHEQIGNHQYYNCKSNNVNLGQGILSRRFIQRNESNRIRSTDLYILTKRVNTKPPPIILQQTRQDNISPLSRNRTKSCGIKLQLYSKIPHILQVY